MFSSAFDPQTPPDALRPRATKPPAPTEEIPDRAVLENVLQQTLIDQSADALDAAERAALEAVAGRYRGQPFELDPVAVELVEAVLRIQFKSSASLAGASREMCYEIARTLFEDPVSRERLQAMWVRLCDSQR